LEGLSDFVNIQKLTATMIKAESGNTIGLSNDSIGDLPSLLADSEYLVLYLLLVQSIEFRILQSLKLN